MIKSLHIYLGRDLLKVTSLAVVAFTLILTVFAIIEPLRKQQGVAPEQVMALFGYLLPWTLSLTLPIGALFASTIVYGRFSQDNEMLACRASGISTLTLLKPAIALGAGVTLISLWLSNFVAPAMLANSKTTFESNVKAVAYKQLKTRGYFTYADRMVRADYVDEAKDELHGLMVADVKTFKPDKNRKNPSGAAAGATAGATFGSPKPYGGRMIVASKAYLRFGRVRDLEPQRSVDLPYVQVLVKKPTVVEPTSNLVVSEGSQVLTLLYSDEVLKEQPAWMNWDRLLSVMNDPVSQRQMANRLDGIRQDIINDMLARQVVQQSQTWEGCVLQRPGLDGQPQQRLVIKAPLAGVLAEGAERKPALSASTRPAGDAAKPDVKFTGKKVTYAQLQSKPGRPVEVQVYDYDGQSRTLKLSQTYLGASAQVGAGTTDMSDISQVSVTLTGPVQVVSADRPAARATTTAASPVEIGRSKVSWGELPIPGAIIDRAKKISDHELFNLGRELPKNPRSLSDDSGVLTENPRILGDLRNLCTISADRLLGEIKGEMHSRVAYSLSCFLLVCLGAALGLIFRGGQFISAFAIAVIPGSLVIIMLVMGKALIENAKLRNDLYGLAAIWGGIAVMLLANLFVYTKLARE